jgi:phosphomannomutase
VARAIIEDNACLGVEPSGHYTDPCFALTSSGSLFAVLIAGLVYRSNLKELLSVLPEVNIESASLTVDDRNSFMDKVRASVNSVISDVDGIKFSFNGGTALIRPSGTEPIIRFHLENPYKTGGVQDLVSRFR